jgi:sugar/nucleoside kinase (ribokinase family)
MSTRRGVLVAGNLVLDTVVLPVPDSPPWNTSYWVDAIEHHLGGNGANTSHAIAKLGVPARALGYVGEDPAGDRVLAILQGAGVDTRAVERVDLPTAATVALVREDGARCFLHCPGASTKAFQQAPAITAALAEGCGFFHLANPFGVPGLRSNAPEILRQARAAGLCTSIDAGWDSRGEWMKVFGPCLPAADVVFVNAEEARLLTGLDDPNAAARALRAGGAGCIVLKLGARGCSVHAEGGEWTAAGFPVKAVDTTGAGDCFAGGFIAALARGYTLPEAARFANAVGALSVGKAGSTAGLLSFEGTLAWMGGGSAALPERIDGGRSGA